LKNNVLWVLRSQSLTEFYITASQPIIQKKWNELTRKNKEFILKVLTVSKSYLNSGEYKQELTYDKANHGVKRFLRNRIYEDKIPVSRLIYILNAMERMLR